VPGSHRAGYLRNYATDGLLINSLPLFFQAQSLQAASIDDTSLYYSDGSIIRTGFPMKPPLSMTPVLRDQLLVGGFCRQGSRLYFTALGDDKRELRASSP
jgi:hypothetical protein